MKFLLVPIIVWVISQTIKFLVRFIWKKERALQDALWIYQWGSGAPSTHAAMVTAFVYLAGRYDNYGPLFGLSFTVAILLIYDLVAERKKWELFEEYLSRSRNESLQNIVRDGKLRDITGHTVLDIVIGVVVGILSGVLLSKFLF